MLSYRGLSGGVRVLLERVKSFLTGSAKPPPVGSRAWEAKLELDKLPRVIEARMKLLEKGTGAATAAKLRAEIDASTNSSRATRRRSTGSTPRPAPASSPPSPITTPRPSPRAIPRSTRPKVITTSRTGRAGTSYASERTAPRTRWSSSRRAAKPPAGRHARQIPGLSLNQNQLRNVLDAMSAGQAAALADAFTPAGVERLANAGPRELKAAIHAYERIAPLMDDPVARRGIERVTQSGHMSPEAAVRAINGVPVESLRDLMRVFGDPKWTHHPHAMGPDGIVAFAKNADELAFIARYGLDARNELTRSRDHRRVFGHLLEAMHDLKVVEAAKLVEKVLAERTPVKREKALDLPARPKRRTRYAGSGDSIRSTWRSRRSG